MKVQKITKVSGAENVFDLTKHPMWMARQLATNGIRGHNFEQIVEYAKQGKSMRFPSFAKELRENYLINDQEAQEEIYIAFMELVSKETEENNEG